MEIFLEGFLLQAGLILALGAQNLFVLESGLKRQHHAFVALVCSVCDLILILVGVVGAATIFVQVPLLKILFGFLGCGFLFYYGVLKIREALHPAHQAQSAHVPRSLKQTVWTTLAFSLLNPHVYLDTVVLIAGYAARFPSMSNRLQFGMGAAAFSWVWFFALAFLASAFHKMIHNPNAMRAISALSGSVLLILGCKLGLDVWAWVGN